MWPQYEFAAYPDEKWILVNLSQQWFQDILRALSSSKKVQKKDAVVMERFSLLLRESLVNARHAIVDHSASAKIRCTFGNNRALDIKVHGHVLRAVNSLRPFLMKADDNTWGFLQGPFVAFVKHVFEQATEDDGPSADGETIQAVSGFSFGEASCPNIRDKVIWCPGDCAWKISVRKTSKALRPGTDSSGNSFRVDPCLPEEEYKAALSDAYHRAIDTWNEADGSNRERIRTRFANPEDARMFARWCSDDVL
jgi:hypothetical protein